MGGISSARPPGVPRARGVRPWGRAGVAAAVACVALLAAAAAAVGQGITTSALRGQVVDLEGTPVPDARVELRHDRTGAVAVTTTDGSGRFYVPNVRPGGPYALVVERVGFRSATREDLSLRLGQTLEVTVRLAGEAVPLPEIAVEIETDPEFHPSRMGIATLVDEPALERLPTISRDFVEFAQLSPLVRADEDEISFAGTSFRFNNIQVDGALNQDVFGLSPSGIAGGRAQARVVPLGAIEELQVLVAPYDVRQSGFTGGVLNAVTRSGTNEWEGSAFGFVRDEALVGDLVVDDVPRSPEELDNLYAGFTLGGPIRRDRLHLFAAGEIERQRRPPDGLHVGVHDPLRTQLPPDSVARLEQLLAGHGADPGTAGTVTLENGLANLFGRLDVRIDERNSAMLRYNFAAADDDPPPNRLPGDAYELTSHGTEISSRNHSLVGQWLAEWGGSLSNELLVNLQFLRDRETPVADDPRVEVDIAGFDEGNVLERRVRAGAEFFAHDSELEQDILQVTDAVTWATGAHRITFGGAFERFRIRRLFLPGSRGTYRFDSLADLAANRPARYDINVPVGEDPWARFTVRQWGGFVQDEWRVSDALNLRFGLRVDVPTIGSRPTFNPAVEEDLGIDTSVLPSGNPLFSPRFGFNLRLGEERGTQVRGGVGLFSGRPAFAWLANAFQNTGLESVFLTCEIEVRPGELFYNAPPFDPTAPSPTRCVDGSGPEAGTPGINAFDPDFRFPQDLKMSLAIDQRLPLGLVGSLEWIYTKAVNQIFLEDRNLGFAVLPEARLDTLGYTLGFGFLTRQAFGDPTVTGFEPRRRSDRLGPVMWMTNRSENFAYAISARLRRRFGERFLVDAAYSYNRSGDTQSLFSLDATSNYGFTAVETDPRRPKRQPSLFDRPHKVVVQAAARVLEGLGGTEIALLYVGQSGRPYSYVYTADINGDAFPGDGQALDLANDLVYVPEVPFEFPTPGGVSGLVFETLVARDACLDRNRSRVVFRNACRAAWSDQLDLRITQNVRIGPARAHLYLDMLNVLNFLDREWGHVERASPVVRIIEVPGRYEDDAEERDEVPEPEDPLEGRFNGPVERTEEGGLRAVLPTTPAIPASQWQAQVGVRVSF